MKETDLTKRKYDYETERLYELFEEYRSAYMPE